MRSKCLADEFFIREWAVGLRRIEECHATFDGCSNHSYGLLLFDGWTVAVAQPHAAESKSRDFQPAFSHSALLHVVLLA